jgi:hypothetical protein
VAQTRNGARLAFETLADLGSAGTVLGKNLDGDDAIEACVFRAINLAQPKGKR